MKKLISLLVFLALLLTSCRISDLVSISDYDQAYDIVRTAVPFAMSGNAELSSSKLFLKETDAYGRQMFLYQYGSSFSVGSIDIWIICQQTDPWDPPEAKDQFAYYYPDACYMILPRDTQPTEEALAAFEARNDWGKPLQPEKYASVQYVYKSNRRIIESYDRQCVSKIREYLNFTPADNFMCDELELNEEGVRLILAMRYTDAQQKSEIQARHECYLLLYHKESETVLAAKEVPASLVDSEGDLSEIRTFIKEFKSETGF